MRTNNQKRAKMPGKIESRRFSIVLDPNKDVLEEVANSQDDIVYYLRQMGDGNTASKLFNKYTAGDQDPYFLEYRISHTMKCIYHNSNYGSKTILANYQKELQKNPDLINNSSFMDYFLFFKKIQKTHSDNKIDDWLRQDLEEIVNMCLRNNVRIIIQEYPYSYPDADKALMDTASRYSLPLVKNGEKFRELLSKNGKRYYFLDDSHCTASGYRAMAENVYEVISSERIFTK
jgi:hypothetical protein